MFNRVQIIGRIGKAPEGKATSSGDTIASFSVATSEKVKGKDRTEWHSCTAFGKVAEIVINYADKGALVFIDGSLRTSKWTGKDGQEKQRTDIIVGQVRLLSWREGGDKPQANTKPQASDAPTDDFGDDIPF